MLHHLLYHVGTLTHVPPDRCSPTLSLPHRNFQSLAKRNFHANEAAALALKFASGAVPRPLDPKAFVLDAQGGADMRVVLNRLANMFSTPETLAATFARKRSSAVGGFCCWGRGTAHLLLVVVGLSFVPWQPRFHTHHHHHHHHETQHGNGHVTIDFEALDAVYYSFTDDPTITATLLSASSRTVEQLVAEAIQDPSGSTAVTSALILLENPLLEETENHWYVWRMLMREVAKGFG